jgi:hypothetical protein
VGRKSAFARLRATRAKKRPGSERRGDVAPHSRRARAEGASDSSTPASAPFVPVARRWAEPFSRGPVWTPPSTFGSAAAAAAVASTRQSHSVLETSHPRRALHLAERGHRRDRDPTRFPVGEGRRNPNRVLYHGCRSKGSFSSSTPYPFIPPVRVPVYREQGVGEESPCPRSRRRWAEFDSPGDGEERAAYPPGTRPTRLRVTGRQDSLASS